MPPSLEMEVASSPSAYPQKLDLARNAVLLIRMSSDEYRAASFLDDRVLTERTEGCWASYPNIKSSAATITTPRPLHFIFHSGHVGSTLLSRLLDESRSVLGLREPLPLRTLAELHDRTRDPSQVTASEAFNEYLGTFLKLWGRGFSDTELVVLKATSTAARIAGPLLQALPAARAVYLNLPPEPYLATLLAGENSLVDLRGFLPERLRRLRSLLGADPQNEVGGSVGRVAALSWLTERLTQVSASRVLENRLLSIDFESFLADPGTTISRTALHFGMSKAQDLVSKAMTSTVLSRYSKAPEQYAYSPSFRRQILAQARRDHADEIREGLAFLEAIARRHAAVAEVL